MSLFRARLSTAILVGVAAFATASPSSAVVGGRLASAGEYPWMAAVYLSRPTSFYCGGTLVAPTVVVTAAHCVLGAPAPGITGVMLGRTALNGSGGEQIPVVSMVIHPAYNVVTNVNDVAVLLLSRASAQTPLPWARPGQESYWATGVMTTVTGWGLTREGGSPSNDLKEAEVPVWDDASCRSIYGLSMTPSAHVCAGYPNGGTDTCQGDSGGPLMVPGPNNKFILAGITSFGEGCARRNRPGVYTEVASVSTFIDLFA